MYNVVLGDDIAKDLAKIHPTIVAQIREKIDDHIAHFPKDMGKRLKGEFRGLNSNRHGDYRIIYRIIEREKTIIITNIGHRGEIYDK
jgi:mRNA interferase RelE/StbE